MAQMGCYGQIPALFPLGFVSCTIAFGDYLFRISDLPLCFNASIIPFVLLQSLDVCVILASLLAFLLIAKCLLEDNSAFVHYNIMVSLLRVQPGLFCVPPFCCSSVVFNVIFHYN